MSICNYIVMKKDEGIIDISKLEEFGRNLRAERHRVGLSQDALGELIGIDGRHISKIENGRSNPKLSTIIAILEALKLPFEALYKTNIN